MPASQQLDMTIGFGDHAAFRALKDGTVKPEGINLTCVTEIPEPWMIELERRVLDGTHDASELSTSYFTQNKLAGKPLVGIPVFPFRAFRHRCIYCHEGSGIKTPADLKGKRVGLHSYTASTMIWVRGIVRDEYGVRPQDIDWLTVEDKGLAGPRDLGVSINLVPVPAQSVTQIEVIAGMVQRGELDAMFAPGDVTRPGIYRLFPNHAEVEAEYYRRTGIFPIIHSFVIGERVFRNNPWVPRALIKAFRQSSALAPNYMAEGRDLKHWDTEVWEADRHILAGRDPFACGMGSGERRALEAFLDYLMMDGAIKSKPAVDSLFPPFESYEAT